MESKSFYGQPMKLTVVDIQKHKLSAEEAIFFEMDILIQMMRALTQDNVKGISMEVSAMSVEQGNKIGETFSMRCMLPVAFPKEVTERLRSAEESKDIQEKMDTYDYLMQTYAVMSTDVAFYNTIWGGNNAVTCRFIIEMKSGESMKIGPFKLIDLVRDFKRWQPSTWKESYEEISRKELGLMVVDKEWIEVNQVSAFSLKRPQDRLAQDYFDNAQYKKTQMQMIGSSSCCKKCNNDNHLHMWMQY